MSRNILVLLLALSLVLGTVGAGMLMTDFELDDTDDNNVDNGGDNSGVEINSETVNITICKYYDHDGDGEFDEDDGDEMLSGWDFELDVKNGTSEPWEVLRKGNTSDDGCLTFEVETDQENERGKHFRVREILKEGWYFTGGNVTGGSAEGDADFEVEEGEVGITFWDHKEDVELWFGNREKPREGEITAYKFQDVDGDGDYDEGEEMLEDWDFTLWNTTDEGDKDTIIDTATTNGSGAATFEDVSPGDYIVEEDLKEGWYNTTSLQQSVTVEEDDEKELWFGNLKYGKIVVTKFNDMNMDGRWNTGEPLLDGFYFTVGENLSGYSGDWREGRILFDQLVPGNYTIKEHLPEGWVNTTPLEVNVTVRPGVSHSILFGNVQSGNITVRKYNDSNMNGSYDEGEEMLENWTFNLWTTDEEGGPEEIIANETTDEDGMVHFDDVMPGDYIVQEELKDGWKNTTMQLQEVTVEPDKESELWFGNVEETESGNITAYKFYDENMDGKYQEEEMMLENWTFNLWTTDEEGGPKEIIATETTDEDGMVHFDDVMPGDYIVQEELKDGWKNTTMQLQGVTVEGDHSHELWFGNVEETESGNITAYKFYDSNMNGSYDEGEEMLENWTFNLWTTDEEGGPKEIIATETTDEDGMVHFDDVKPGDYIVQEELKDGWTNTTMQLQGVTVEGDHSHELWFGNVEETKSGNITAYKFYDENMDGKYQEEEMMLENWTFNLWTTDEEGGPQEIIDTQVTGENGAAYFEEVAPGDYIVQEELRECWFNTTPLLQPVTVESGEESILRFGNIPGGSIEGYKFCDRNMNQEFDDDEEGLEGWTINLYKDYEDEMPADHHEPYMTTTTDEKGHYGFKCLEPGDYIIEEEMRDGWYNSTSYYYEVTIEPEGELRYDFGNYQYQDITGIKFYDFTMSGEFEPMKGDIPLRDREVQLYEGNETSGDPIKTTYTDEYGYYSFGGLESGKYTVYQPETCCDWIRTTPQEVTVEIGKGCEDEEVNFGEYKMSTIDVYVEDETSGIGIEIYEYDPDSEETGDLVDSGETGPDGWYISIELEPGYYMVELEDGQYELVQLRMGEQVEFDKPEMDYDPTEILAIRARHTKIK